MYPNLIRWLIAAGSFAILFVMLGCHAAESLNPQVKETTEVLQSAPPQNYPSPTSKETNKKYRIALSNSYIGNSWRAETMKIFEAYAQQKKADQIIADYYGSSTGVDPQAQINEIRRMISKGYDAILVNAASPNALVSVLNEAVNRGIIVVTFDNTVESDKIYAVGTDLVEFGRLQAEWLAKQIQGQGNILIIRGVEGTTAVRDRYKGYQEVLAKNPGIQVLQEGYGEWDDATTAVVIDKMLNEHKNERIAGILAESGQDAVIEALKKHQIDPATVPITGDMINGFFRHMKEDQVQGFAVGQPPYLVAIALDTALSALKGEKVERRKLVPLSQGDYTEINRWYLPHLPDSFFVDWTDEKNSFGLKLEQVIPENVTK